MSKTNTVNSQPTKLTSQVEDLAMSLLLAENVTASAEKWGAALSRITEAAKSEGNELASKIALEMTSKFEAGDEAAAKAALEEGLCRLQQALSAPPEMQKESPNTFAVTSISDDPELVGDFILESKEHLSSIEGRLLALEEDSSDLEAIHSVFRSFHTIKGLAGFLELHAVKDVAHEVETVLDHAREGLLTIDARVIDVVLASADWLGQWLAHLEVSTASSAPSSLKEYSGLISKIRGLLDHNQSEVEPAPVSPALATGSAAEPSNESPTVPSPVNSMDVPVDSSAVDPKEPTKERTNSRTSGVRSVKVDTDKLDYLVDMVGEMVIAQSVVRNDQEIVASKRPELLRNLSQLARITDEVQRTALSMRMVPIGPLFQKMARLVRDLTRKFGKQVRFESVGEDVELDRTIVEELADPLMHMIRNSMDHGVESPESRTAAGKSPVAKVELRAFHMAGQIVIQVCDDGKGLDREKIRAKAVKAGLIAPNVNLSDNECFGLIFQPGFSTADQLSDVSGRGVGMDVVKRQIQKLRGSIEIQSTPGQGTTFSLKLPLTMAIIDGLVVCVGAERFIVPIFSVREMVRPTPEMVTTVEGRAEVVLLRNNLLPVIRLYERFNLKPRSTDPSECVLIVTETEGRPFCLMVDELVGKQEVVIKSLGPSFQKVSGVAGGAILGDGRIGLILDMKGVFAKKIND